MLTLSFFPFSSTQGKYQPRFSNGKAKFTLKFKNNYSRYKILAITVLPEESLLLEARYRKETIKSELSQTAGQSEETPSYKWQWKAPKEPGLYPLVLSVPSLKDSMTLQMFVMVPFDHVRGGRLNGFRVGNYRRLTKENNFLYRQPRGFIEVTPETRKAYVSPHFQLWQFMDHQQTVYPRYMILHERLVFKLEMILEALNKEGHHVQSLRILSGYRTPYHNKKIKGKKFSLHMWGRAVDMIVDSHPKDGKMDDLNGDKKINKRDGQVFHNLVEELFKGSDNKALWGGLGLTKKSKIHGPFLHVDVREVRPRWKQ